MLAQYAHERGRRVVGQDPVRAEQHNAWRRAAGKRDQPAEVEVVGEHHVPMLARPREYLRVGCPTVTDGVPVSGFDAGTLQRLDPS